MSNERDKFLTEAMGGCAQDEGYYRDSGYLCCSKCRNIVAGIGVDDQCLGLTNFSTWEGFGKLWEWATKQEWWAVSYGGGMLSDDGYDIGVVFVNPDRFADVTYEFLKWSPKMTQFRVTRPNLYDPGALGHYEPAARQGYYIDATSEEEAIQKMKARFPEDSKFDVEVWKK